MIFVDSSFWIALVRPEDARHAEAAALARAHVDAKLFTTNHVRGETWTFIRRRAGHRAATRFLDSVPAAADVIHVSKVEEEDALRWLRRHDEREYSFVDATSFVVMSSLKLRQALAFDGDFAAAGFVELRA